MKKIVSTVVAIALAVLGATVLIAPLFLQGCNSSDVVKPELNLPENSSHSIDSVAGRKGDNESSALAVGPAWEAYILSEAFYMLSQSRNGSSPLVYNGLAMGSWPYPWAGDCCDALGKVTKHMYGTPTSSSRGPLGKWLDKYQQAGECKFCVNLCLYRSSYGYPGGHIVLPKSTYSYSGGMSWRSAQPGYILQSASMPHTAIVVANFGDGGLDVIDANWVGGRGSYALARHTISKSTLDANGFKAYRAHEACTLIG